MAADQSDDLFAGPKLKIERAKHHIADHRAAYEAFAKSDAVRFFAEFDPDTGDLLFGPERGPDPTVTDELRVTAADAIYNLRAALDQAATRCAVLAGKSPNGTYFPHGVDEAGFKASLGGKCQKIPEPVRQAIAALEPYYGGAGYLFRVLHDLNLVDKHTSLIDVGVVIGKMSIEKNVPPIGGGTVWQREKDKLVARDAADFPNVDYHVQVTVSVSFTEVDAVRGESVTGVLYKLTNQVLDGVSIIEAAMTDWLSANR